MPDFSIFTTASSALAAQSVRLNTVASNLANADAVAARPQDTYQPRVPIFKSTEQGVEVTDVVKDQSAPLRRYQPGHPQADAEGYVYVPKVDVVEEMANMISASRSYQSSVEVMNTTKDLMMRLLNVGRR